VATAVGNFLWAKGMAQKAIVHLDMHGLDLQMLGAKGVARCSAFPWGLHKRMQETLIVMKRHYCYVRQWGFEMNLTPAATA